MPFSLGRRLYRGIWPPSKPGRVLGPPRDFWPRLPKPQGPPCSTDTGGVGVKRGHEAIHQHCIDNFVLHTIATPCQRHAHVLYGSPHAWSQEQGRGWTCATSPPSRPQRGPPCYGRQRAAAEQAPAGGPGLKWEPGQTFCWESFFPLYFPL